jgi:hypothetical protein
VKSSETCSEKLSVIWLIVIQIATVRLLVFSNCFVGNLAVLKKMQQMLFRLGVLSWYTQV